MEEERLLEVCNSSGSESCYAINKSQLNTSRLKLGDFANYQAFIIRISP